MNLKEIPASFRKRDGLSFNNTEPANHLARNLGRNTLIRTVYAEAVVSSPGISERMWGSYI